MIDKKSLKMNGLALLLFSVLTLICETTTSVKAQSSDKKMEVSTSHTCSATDAHNGMRAMFTFLRENIEYPSKAIEAKIQGDVTIDFTVTKEGAITNSRITKKLCPALDIEVLETVKRIPASEFVEKEGQKVNTDYKITIKFALPDGTSLTKPTVSIVEVETENLKMTLMRGEKKDGANSATIATYNSSVKKDTILTQTVITTISDE